MRGRCWRKTGIRELAFGTLCKFNKYSVLVTLIPGEVLKGSCCQDNNKGCYLLPHCVLGLVLGFIHVWWYWNLSTVQGSSEQRTDLSEVQDHTASNCQDESWDQSLSGTTCHAWGPSHPTPNHLLKQTLIVLWQMSNSEIGAVLLLFFLVLSLFCFYFR